MTCRSRFRAPNRRTDADIAQAVRRSLDWNALIPGERIRSTVADGWVTLEGEVHRWSQRIDAESGVRYLAGVHGVTNRIVVAAPTGNTTEIRHAIETALERRAEREARRIDVDVEDGVLTLSGVVRTWLEKQSVLGAAGHAPGIRAVKDHLEVDPYS
jgi:osmotically-inducible protein OsmY